MRRINLLVVGFLFALWLGPYVTSVKATSTTSDHLVLGNPSGATTSTTAETNYLIQRQQYALSYHRHRGIPNWVSWHLDSGDLGNTDRQDFITDTSLPTGWYRVTTSDYTGSGYDRGHMTPSGDRTRTVSDNQATFIMTNIIPQAPDNNQGPWNSLEQYTRDQLAAGNEAYIISGGFGSKGTLSGGKLTIPTRTWKVIVIMPTGSNDAARVTTSTRVIAVNLPNDNGIRTVPWQNYLTTVDAIEQLTGYNLLSNVSDSVENVIEARVDGNPNPAPTATPAPNPTATPIPAPTATPIPGTGCATGLFFSEYVEGSSNNKALEIYNGTGSTVNLTGYSIKLFSNGGTTASSSLNLSGSLAAGDVYVIANSSASSALLTKADMTSGVAGFNGNDAVVLYLNSSAIDAFGDIGYDPGAGGWEAGTATATTDRTLVRKSSIHAGDTNSTDSFYPSQQWNGFAIDTFSSIGAHVCQ